MKTALIEDRGRQYKVKQNDVIAIDKICNEGNDFIEFDKVLLIHDENNINIGSPYIKNVKVKAQVLENVRDKKVIVFKFKRRKNYKRTKGHKQPYTLVKISEITA